MLALSCEAAPYTHAMPVYKDLSSTGMLYYRSYGGKHMLVSEGVVGEKLDKAEDRAEKREEKLEKVGEKLEKREEKLEKREEKLEKLSDKKGPHDGHEGKGPKDKAAKPGTPAQ